MNNGQSLIALVAPEPASTILSYDHHRVRVGERWGVLLTYGWMELPVLPDVLELEVVVRIEGLNAEQSRIAILKHPQAPPEIQALIDGLEFAPKPTGL